MTPRRAAVQQRHRIASDGTKYGVTMLTDATRWSRAEEQLVIDRHIHVGAAGDHLGDRISSGFAVEKIGSPLISTPERTPNPLRRPAAVPDHRPVQPQIGIVPRTVRRLPRYSIPTLAPAGKALACRQRRRSCGDCES